jgi:hypothetical protein
MRWSEHASRTDPDDDHRTVCCTEFTMDALSPKSVIVLQIKDESPASSFRRIIHKSALLNAVIILTSFPVLVVAGGPNAVVPTVAIMIGITVLIWSATFTLFSCVALGRILWTACSTGTGRKPRYTASKAGVADRWLDGPG